METGPQRPRIGGILAYLLLVMLCHPAFVGARFWMRNAILGEAFGYDAQWQRMTVCLVVAVVIVAACDWFAVWCLWTRREAPAVTTALRSLWIGTAAVILLDFVAVFGLGGFATSSPLFNGYWMFSMTLLFMVIVMTRYLRVAPRALRTYPPPPAAGKAFD